MLTEIVAVGVLITLLLHHFYRVSVSLQKADKPTETLSRVYRVQCLLHSLVIKMATVCTAVGVYMWESQGLMGTHYMILVIGSLIALLNTLGLYSKGGAVLHGWIYIIGGVVYSFVTISII